MKRIAMALPLVAAMVLFCATVWAGESAAAASLIVDPLPTVQAHWLVTLMVVLIPAVRTGLSNDTVKLPTAAAPLRALIVALLAGASTIFDGLMNGFDLKTAMMSFLALGLPSIVQEILKFVFGAKPTDSGGGAAGGTGIRPPPGYSSAMKALTLGVVALSVGGCSWFKANGCKTIRMAADACDTIVVILPDGTEERVPASAIAGVAMSARAARAAQPMPTDAGADK